MKKRNISFYMTGAFARVLKYVPELLPEYTFTAFCPNKNAYNICNTSSVFTNTGYMYENFNSKFDSLDEEVILRKFEHINLSEVLYADKSSYKRKSGKYQKRIVLTMAIIIQEWFEKVKPDYIFFPIIESIDAMLAYRIAQLNGIKPICYAHGRHINFSFFSEQHTEVLPSYYTRLQVSEKTQRKAELLVNEFRQNPSQLKYTTLENEKIGQYEDSEKSNAFNRLLNNIVLRLKNERHNQFLNLWIKFQVFIERVLVPIQKIAYLAIETIYLKPIKNFPPNYDYFPLHFAPESSINTPAPFFIDQIRVIDKILLERKGNLPLIIKEHPAMFSKRPLSFYRRLKKIPFVQFAPQASSSIMLLKSANTVYSVTGTVCLEAFLLDIKWKQYGDNFLKSWVEDRKYASKSLTPVEFVSDVLNVSGDFLLYSPGRNLNRNKRLFSRENVKNLAQHIEWHIKQTIQK